MSATGDGVSRRFGARTYFSGLYSKFEYSFEAIFARGGAPPTRSQVAVLIPHPRDSSILRTRGIWRPPSNSVLSQTRTIASASASVTMRWPSESTLASLCDRFQIATCSVQQRPQRTPRTRLATIASPFPEPPSTMPRSKSSAETASATGRTKSG